MSKIWSYPQQLRGSDSPQHSKNLINANTTLQSAKCIVPVQTYLLFFLKCLNLKESMSKPSSFVCSPSSWLKAINKSHICMIGILQHRHGWMNNRPVQRQLSLKLRQPTSGSTPLCFDLLIFSHLTSTGALVPLSTGCLPDNNKKSTISTDS